LITSGRHRDLRPRQKLEDRDEAVGKLGDDRVVRAISDTFLRIQPGNYSYELSWAYGMDFFACEGVVSWLARQFGNDFLA